MNIRHIVVNEKADRQHAIASALELPSTWAKKVDYYNLGARYGQRIMQVYTYA